MTFRSPPFFFLVKFWTLALIILFFFCKNQNSPDVSVCITKERTSSQLKHKHITMEELKWQDRDFNLLITILQIEHLITEAKHQGSYWTVNCWVLLVM